MSQMENAPRQLMLENTTVLIKQKSVQHFEDQITAPIFHFRGEKGIRTLGPQMWSTVFETAPIDHSGISPFLARVK